ncbi:hypothetical protein KDL01_06475 [Actinospica durhamensis]|uniref:DUF3592 domain-containing protein n=1 Tax=Actinospica durhamensis TaxID=1508375 RepID=A0A941EPQ7_9ACTN|nr:hypothetical protein [Actinospica durhamensis]MBR7832899.1 hypothetical protein [Actinospica durhamensis]
MVALVFFGFGLSQLLSTYAANDPNAVSVTVALSDYTAGGDPDSGYTNYCDATWTWHGVRHEVSQMQYQAASTSQPLWIDPSTGDFLPHQGLEGKFAAYAMFGFCDLPLLLCVWFFGLRIAFDRLSDDQWERSQRAKKRS